MTCTLESADTTQGQGVRPWVAVAAAVFCIGWGGNQFTPLLIAYAQHSGYTRVDVDILLGAYVIGLIPGCSWPRRCPTATADAQRWSPD